MTETVKRSLTFNIVGILDITVPDMTTVVPLPHLKLAFTSSGPRVSLVGDIVPTRMTLVKSSESAPSVLWSSECVITSGRSSCENVIARDENAKLESDTELGGFKEI